MSANADKVAPIGDEELMAFIEAVDARPHGGCVICTERALRATFARLDAAERERDEAKQNAAFFKVENDSRAILLRLYHDIIGYNNDDGFHSEPPPETILRNLITERDALKRENDGMRALVTDCQNDLSEWIVPDSGISDHDILNRLLGRLDGPQARAALAAGPAEKE